MPTTATSVSTHFARACALWTWCDKTTMQPKGDKHCLLEADHHYSDFFIGFNGFPPPSLCVSRSNAYTRHCAPSTPVCLFAAAFPLQAITFLRQKGAARRLSCTSLEGKQNSHRAEPQPQSYRHYTQLYPLCLQSPQHCNVQSMPDPHSQPPTHPC